jgi:hypothetical protein
MPVTPQAPQPDSNPEPQIPDPMPEPEAPDINPTPEPSGNPELPAEIPPVTQPEV